MSQKLDVDFFSVQFKGVRRVHQWRRLFGRTLYTTHGLTHHRSNPSVNPSRRTQTPSPLRLLLLRLLLLQHNRFCRYAPENRTANWFGVQEWGGTSLFLSSCFIPNHNGYQFISELSLAHLGWKGCCAKITHLYNVQAQHDIESKMTQILERLAALQSTETTTSRNNKEDDKRNKDPDDVTSAKVNMYRILRFLFSDLCWQGCICFSVQIISSKEEYFAGRGRGWV